jgi:hypothetical protein
VFQEVEVSKFEDNQHMKVRLLALRTDRLYPTGKIPVTLLLVAESTPEPDCGRQDVNENFQ